MSLVHVRNTPNNIWKAHSKHKANDTQHSSPPPPPPPLRSPGEATTNTASSYKPGTLQRKPTMRTSASTRPKPPQGKHKLSYLFRSLRSHASSAWRRKGRGLWKVAEVNGIRTRLKRSKVVLVRDESGANPEGRSG